MTPDPLTDALDDDARAAAARLDALMRAEAAACGGRLPFDRFMDLALYAPGLGYYTGGAVKLGRGGDFVTAPEISPLFGRALAGQCREALDRLGGGDLLELGAGSGALAVELVRTLSETGAPLRRYRILEVSGELRARQEALVRERLGPLAGRVEWLHGLPGGFTGVVVANEVLDAMPVHRFRIGDAGVVEEIFVEPREAGWREMAGPLESPGLGAAVQALQAAGLALAAGYVSEVNLRLAPWLAALADAIDRALVILVDYGYPEAEYYLPERRAGTLLCHFRHGVHGDPCRVPGHQDITAHVDFSAAARGARAAGFDIAGYTTQAHFLLGCGLDRLLADIAAGPDAVPALAAARQLVMPTGLGERFRVLGLARGVAGPWCGFSVRDLQDRL